jgi:hypothetical protein
MPAKRGAAVIKKEEEKDDDAGSKVVDVAHASSPTAESPKGTPQRLVEESPAVSGKRKVSSHNHPRCPAASASSATANPLLLNTLPVLLRVILLVVSFKNRGKWYVSLKDALKTEQAIRFLLCSVF